ncbi:MAG: hypothetical protein IPJ66_11415 [Bacteroidetes bacterium]|nr:hypothetical protein [Bacteroidota bacterium]
MSKFEDGKIAELVAPQSFTVNSLNAASMAATDKKALDAFCKKVSELRRATASADAYRGELSNKLKFIKQAILDAPAALPEALSQVTNFEKRMVAVNTSLNGDASMAKREFEIPTSINSRVSAIESSLWAASTAPTQTAIQSLQTAGQQFEPVLQELKKLDQDIRKLEDLIEANKAPYTPGRIPEWKNK